MMVFDVPWYLNIKDVSAAADNFSNHSINSFIKRFQ